MENVIEQRNVIIQVWHAPDHGANRTEVYENKILGFWKPHPIHRKVCSAVNVLFDISCNDTLVSNAGRMIEIKSFAGSLSYHVVL